MILRLWVALPVAATLACSGLDFFPRHDLEDATAEEAHELGYALRPGASHVFVKRRGVMDVRSTWQRYDLPAAELAAYEAEIATVDGIVRDDTWTQPSDWPTFDAFQEEGFAHPPWFPPDSGRIYVREWPHTETDNGNTEALVVFFEDHTVTSWSWMVQWWTLE